MRTSRLILAGVVAALAAVSMVERAEAVATCAVCSLVLGLLEEDGGKGPEPSALNPDVGCELIGLCKDGCKLWTQWPNVTSPTVCSGRGTPASPCTDGGAVDDSKTFPNGSTLTAPEGLATPDVFDTVGDRVMSAWAAVTGAGMSPEVGEALRTLRENGMRLGALGDGNAADVAPHSLAALFALRDAEAERIAQTGRGFDYFEATQIHVRATAASVVKAARNPVGDWPCALTNISCIAQHVFDAHLPLADSDGDNFAGGNDWLFSDGFRGASWRGRDCNDSDAGAYPGHVPTDGDVSVDSNCNGIKGTDASGKSYEEQFCSGDNAPMGVAILGDSAAAHFSIPPEYLNARLFPSLSNLTHALELVSNEADWPQCSWSTGYRTTEGCLLSGTPMNSIYQRMRERNLCIHRDFQNAGVNGARVASVADGIAASMQRSKNDAPILVFHALIGNDVCNGHPGMSHMTTPDEFKASVSQTMTELDARLPAGSHVVFIPLVDGRVLWDTMHGLIHPTGATYPDVYDALICNECSPCWGWMNPNATARNETSARAAQLNAVYPQIIAEFSSKVSFDMYLAPLDFDALIKEYISQGGRAMDLIEPSDGFHPSQVGQQKIAEAIWTFLDRDHPDWLPKTNPNNAQIAALFGDQGGY